MDIELVLCLLQGNHCCNFVFGFCALLLALLCLWLKEPTELSPQACGCHLHVCLVRSVSSGSLTPPLKSSVCISDLQSTLQGQKEMGQIKGQAQTHTFLPVELQDEASGVMRG